MRSVGLFAVLLVVSLAFVAAPQPAVAQADFRAQIRGVVRDEQGTPMPDVTIEFEYTGEKQGRLSKFKATTNKKGGYVRIGLVPGPYKLTYFKEGYKLQSMESYFSGGLSEIPDIALVKIPENMKQFGSAGPSAADMEAARERAAANEKLRKVTEEAVVAVEAQDWETAERLLREVLVKVPDQPLIYFNLGFVCQKRGNLPGAEEAYRKVTELDPTDVESLSRLGIILEAQGKGAEAVAALQQAAPRFQDNKTFQMTLGLIAMNAGRSEEAETAFKRVIEIDPTNGEIHFHLSTLALNKGQTPVAVGHLEKAIANLPETSSNLQLAKDLLAALKKTK